MEYYAWTDNRTDSYSAYGKAGMPVNSPSSMICHLNDYITPTCEHQGPKIPGHGGHQSDPYIPNANYKHPHWHVSNVNLSTEHNSLDHGDKHVSYDAQQSHDQIRGEYRRINGVFDPVYHRVTDRYRPTTDYHPRNCPPNNATYNYQTQPFNGGRTEMHYGSTNNNNHQHVESTSVPVYTYSYGESPLMSGEIIGVNMSVSGCSTLSTMSAGIYRSSTISCGEAGAEPAMSALNGSKSGLFPEVTTELYEHAYCALPHTDILHVPAAVSQSCTQEKSAAPAPVSIASNIKHSGNSSTNIQTTIVSSSYQSINCLSNESVSLKNSGGDLTVGVPCSNSSGSISRQGLSDCCPSAPVPASSTIQQTSIGHESNKLDGDGDDDVKSGEKQQQQQQKQQQPPKQQQQRRRQQQQQQQQQQEEKEHEEKESLQQQEDLELSTNEPLTLQDAMSMSGANDDLNTLDQTLTSECGTNTSVLNTPTIDARTLKEFNRNLLYRKLRDIRRSPLMLQEDSSELICSSRNDEAPEVAESTDEGALTSPLCKREVRSITRIDGYQAVEGNDNVDDDIGQVEVFAEIELETPPNSPSKQPGICSREGSKRSVNALEQGNVTSAEDINDTFSTSAPSVSDIAINDIQGQDNGVDNRSLEASSPLKSPSNVASETTISTLVFPNTCTPKTRTLKTLPNFVDLTSPSPVRSVNVKKRKLELCETAALAMDSLPSKVTISGEKCDICTFTDYDVKVANGGAASEHNMLPKEAKQPDSTTLAVHDSTSNHSANMTTNEASDGHVLVHTNCDNTKSLVDESGNGQCAPIDHNIATDQPVLMGKKESHASKQLQNNGTSHDTPLSHRVIIHQSPVEHTPNIALSCIQMQPKTQNTGGDRNTPVSGDFYEVDLTLDGDAINVLQDNVDQTTPVQCVSANQSLLSSSHHQLHGNTSQQSTSEATPVAICQRFPHLETSLELPTTGQGDADAETALETEFKRLSSLNNPRVQELESFYREQLQCLDELDLAAVDKVGGEGWAAETTSVQRSLSGRRAYLVSRVSRSLRLVIAAATAAAGGGEDSGAGGRRTQRSSRLLSERAVRVMTSWWDTHSHHPYPSAAEREQMAQQGGVSAAQVRAWFANKRVRTLNTRSSRERRRQQQQQQQQRQQVVSVLGTAASRPIHVQPEGAI